MKQTKKPVEQEVTLKNMAMMTPDGVEIKMNGILYRPRFSAAYRYSRENQNAATAEIEALRVFFVNNTTRTFRVRCLKGCEEIIQFSNGCQVGKLFGKLATAKNEIFKSSDREVKESKRKIAEAKWHEASALKASRAVFRKKSIKLPKEVK